MRFGPPSKWNPFSHGASVGELLLIVAFCGLYVWWFCYWYIIYKVPFLPTPSYRPLVF